MSPIGIIDISKTLEQRAVVFYSSAFVKQRTDRKGKPFMGVLKYKESGKWKERRKSFPNARTKKEAELELSRWRVEMEALAEAEAENRPPEKSVVDAIKEHLLTQYNLSDLSRFTFQRQMGVVERIYKPYFNNVDFYQLTKADVAAFVRDLSLRYKPSSTRHYFALLAKTYRQKREDGEILFNPCENVKLPRITPEEISYLDAEGRRKFLQLIKTLEESDYRYLAGMIAFYTGMRASEICALKWEDINYEANTIRVRHSATTVKDEDGRRIVEVGDTKTRAGKRTIPLMPQLVEILKKREEALSPRAKDFVMPEGQRTPSSVCGGFLRWAQDNNVLSSVGKAISLHSLRHTYASCCIHFGMDVKNLAAVLGHAKADITLNVYASDDEQVKQAAIKSVAAALAEEEAGDL